MTEDCIFCKIAEGSEPAHKIYEDDVVVAFLDNCPINPGHILVIPRSHVANFHELDDGIYVPTMLVVKRLARRLQERLLPPKVGLVIAGWDVPHAHIHIIPMHDYHDITSKSMLEGKRSHPSGKELAEVAEQLR